MSATLAAALGGAAGGLALIVLGIICGFCILRSRRNSRSSESNSSGVSLEELHGLRSLTLEELNTATKRFSSANLIAHGTFGEVYKGLLQDGMVVAVKRRQSMPSQEFVQEVNYIASIHHRNLVTLLGYCQENEMQMLVYEYMPNGSISTHLYGTNQASSLKLEFKHRLSIAHGAAKGMKHLHSLNPPMLHMDFRTSNVLVDEDFIPKVADAGLKSLMDRLGGAGPSSRSPENDPFLDPYIGESRQFSVQNDVYSFGVFLAELICGREAASDRSIITWAQNFREATNFTPFVDSRMGSNFTAESMKEFLRLICWCVHPSGDRRPPMSYVEMEIDRIREKEINLTTVRGEGTPTVTLGSQLFTSTRS